MHNLLSRAVFLTVAVIVFTALPMRAVQSDELSRAFLFPELFEIMAAEGRQSVLADGATPLQGRALVGFERDVAAIYDPDVMMDAFVENLEADLRTEQEIRDDALTFAQSDLGKQVIQLEISAREALMDDEVDAAARRALERARHGSAGGHVGQRLDLVRDRIAANDLIELNVSLGLNTSFAYYRGMMAGNAVSGLTTEQLLQLVWAQEADIRADIEDWIESYFLLAYQPLDDADLEAYVTYLSTPFAQAFNRAIFRAFDAVFTDISLEVGRALARRINVEEL